jgi:peptide/nickel transport system substrate-binding protein
MNKPPDPKTPRAQDAAMTQLSRRAFLATSALIAVPAFAADPPKRGGTLVASWGGGEPQALFVPGGGGSSPQLTSTKMLEKLLRMESDLSFSPVLSTGVTQSADGRSFTIGVRDGVLWHDGKAFSAEDVAFSIEQFWKPISAGLAMKFLAGVQATDARTVVVTFSQPTPTLSFMSVCASEPVIPKHVYAGTDIRTNPANNTPIGTGPWKLKEWVRGSHVEFAPNQTYWQAGQPYLDRLVIRWWGEPAARSAAFEAGELHLAFYNAIPIAEMRRLARAGKIVVRPTGPEEGAASTTLEFNSRNPILAKREVRQALLHAVDRSFIADTVYFGNARPAVSALASTNTLFFTADVPKYPFDPKLAGTLLDKAGYPEKNGKRFAVNLLSPGWFPENAKTGAYLKQAFGDVGLDVNLTVPDRPTSLKRIYTDYDYDIAVGNQALPVEPVPTNTQFFTTDGILKGAPFRNANGYSNPKLDALVAQMATEVDSAKRRALMGDFQRLVMTDVPLVQLVEIINNTLMVPNLRSAAPGGIQFADSWAGLSVA